MKFYVIIPNVVIEINCVIVCNPKQQLTITRQAGAKNYSKELKNKGIDLVKSGMTPTEVANFYKIPRNSVKSIIRRAKHRNLEEAPKQYGGRPKLGPRCIRRLIIFVRKNNRMPLFMIAGQFRTLDGVPLTPKTI